MMDNYKQEEFSRVRTNYDKIGALIQAIYKSEQFSELTERYLDITEKMGETRGLPKSYKDFVSKILEENIENFETITAARRLRRKIRDNSIDLKKRWVAMALKTIEKKQNKYLYKEIKPLGEDQEAIDELIEKRTTELNDWSSSIKNKVADYIYIEELSDFKILTAFKYDLLLCVTEILKDTYNFDIEGIRIYMPSIGAPAMAKKQKSGVRRNNYNVHHVKDSSFESDTYTVTSNEDENIQLDFKYVMDFNLIDHKIDKRPENSKLNQVQIIKETLLNNPYSKKELSELSFDDEDLNIARYTFSKTLLFGKAAFDMCELVDFLGAPNTTKTYSRLAKKLKKLPGYTFHTEQKDSKGIVIKQVTYNIFSQITVEKVGNNVRVTAWRSFNEEMEKANLEIMYKNEFKKLKEPGTRNIAFLLEGKRVRELQKHRNIKDIPYRFSMEALMIHVNLDHLKTHKDKMNYLENIIQDIKEEQFIISKYTVNRRLGFFEVYFYDDLEKRERLIENTVLNVIENRQKKAIAE